jgi:hypothetical protein
MRDSKNRTNDPTPEVPIESRPTHHPAVSAQGLRIKIERMDKIEKHALESDFDQYPEKPGDFLNIATQYDIKHNINLLL